LRYLLDNWETTMRERLDCAILRTACSDDWVVPWLGSHAGGRLHLQALGDRGADIAAGGSTRTLADSSMLLRRFDVCLIPVTESNLPWVRTTLSAAEGVVQTPLMALVRGLKAAALSDLYSLGLADFLREPVCIDELRARIERLLDTRRYLGPQPRVASALSESKLGYGAVACNAAKSGQDALCDTILDRSGMELEAFAIASASRCATSRESFRTAKSQVIERFERAYITAALGRHSGNIAMAARAAQKHRRAFWALMRKHEIDAAPFRREPAPAHPRDG
jgi:DNA-binding NtrC family response regulator